MAMSSSPGKKGILAAATEKCIVPGSPGADGVTANCPVFDINPAIDPQSCKILVPDEMKLDTDA